MKLNPKAFELASEATPFEVQEFDGRKVEVYYMNDFEEVYLQNAPKGKFALWTSLDGFNYRLFVEKGYYEKMADLYTDVVNKIWLDFWDQCDDTTKKYNIRIMLPVAILCLVLFLVVSSIPAIAKAATWIQFGILGAFIVGMIFLNRRTKKILAELNRESVDKIKKHLGSKHFEQLMEDQKKYTDQFFEAQARLAEEQEKLEAEEAGETEEVEDSTEDAVSANDLNEEVQVVETEEVTSLEQEEVSNKEEE